MLDVEILNHQDTETIKLKNNGKSVADFFTTLYLYLFRPDKNTQYCHKFDTK